MEGFFVYVLRSEKDGNLYTGFTTNVHRRLKEHNAGKNTSTASRRPLDVIYFEFHLNKYDALRREKYLKTTAGKKALKLMLRENLKAKDENSKKRNQPEWLQP